MEDTQRSQPISINNQGSVENFAVASGRMTEPGLECNQDQWFYGESSLAGIRRIAISQPELVFTSIAHRIDMYLLRKSFMEIRKSKSAGVDKVTAKEYIENLDENLYKLYERLRRGQYAATPVKRIWIDKENGKKRPIGIPALEDKIVQKAVHSILEAIYEVDFYNFSHGFRSGHSQHKAIHEVRERCYQENINWIVNADIAGLFDNIDHTLLKEIISKRVNDGGILRLIGKWLNAGVMEKDVLSYPEKGTPQGGVISPILSNIFLHHVLDDWFVKEVEPRMKGKCFIVRYADDFMIGCQLKSDAERIMAVLPKRFDRFKLALNREKSKLVMFGKPGIKAKKSSETFNFLGFTFYWGKSRRGKMVIKKRTISKRANRFIKTVREWCRDNRHERVGDQHLKLCQKLNGYYQYFGVRSNYESLQLVYKCAKRAWRFWLNRRHRKGRITWENFSKVWDKYPLPRPRIVHNI